jgi:hypothetical protein
MIEMRRKQLSFGDGLIAEEVSDLREDWMPHADEVLADDEIVATVYGALLKRHQPADVRIELHGRCLNCRIGVMGNDPADLTRTGSSAVDIPSVTTQVPWVSMRD